ncbi:DNA mismatch repair endonuclease MutH [Rosenbergiella australiborealis]|uniref:DNA mismatch repair protein MutH n=2 Tax=Rosenbergiella TaxID=1356488 RepID=A0ABS5T7M8_9GAMM|nr:DNA mismatch repair endonuclease MutH [Rosenbergiella australiborealis]MBT0728344.1 DNA mismatch repair endonuclease MutH [Rosenbergiella australiborealis]
MPLPLLTPPQSETELFTRAQHLAGKTFAELASERHIALPASLQRNKGWVGNLIELSLGAQAGSKAEQDFAHLGIELKTIPINAQGVPLETTFVCVVPLTGNIGVTWQESHVRQKLAKVLWIPIEGERQIPLGERRVGNPLLWEPSAQEEQQLHADWEELMEMIALGHVEEITARHGEYLQIRPKAANNRALTEAIGKSGNKILTLPRGFYLKKRFTAPLLAQHFALKNE